MDISTKSLNRPRLHGKLGDFSRFFWALVRNVGACLQAALDASMGIDFRTEPEKNKKHYQTALTITFQTFSRLPVNQGTRLTWVMAQHVLGNELDLFKVVLSAETAFRAPSGSRKSFCKFQRSLCKTNSSNGQESNAPRKKVVIP